MLKKWDTNRKITALVYGAIFLIIFLCNFLTPYLVDDFNYRLSFATKEPLERVWEIIPSMAAHAQSMNGRLTAHSLVQLFMLMPRIVFDLVNSGMFCLLIWLITGYASKERSNLLAIAAFCAIWLYEPAFGEVNLWQDGAINYMWSTVVMLIYLKPFVRLYLDGNSGLDNAAAKLGFLIFSALAGSYSETSSAAAVFIAFLLVVMSAWDAGWKINWYAAISVAAAAVGYLTIYMAPAQWVNKSTELSFKTLLNHFETATQMYTTFGIMAAAAVVFLVVNLSELAEKKTILLGMVFAAGSLAANYIMIFAGYYPDRSAVGAFVLLLTVLAIWVSPILKAGSWRTAVVSAMAVMMLATFPALVSGVKDVATTYLRITENERLIYACRDQGIVHVDVPMISPNTKYSALYGAKYLDMEDRYSWPNDSMSVYYGVESILGVPRVTEEP